MKSINFILLMVIVLVLSVWVHVAEAAAAKNYDGHPIIGTWSCNINGCIEIFEFMTDGTRNSTSAEEVLRATYNISSKPLDSGFYKFTEKVIQDNGKRNCSGLTKDRTGEIVDLYVRFNGQLNQMVFCKEESLKKCFGPFARKQVSSKLVGTDSTNMNLVKIFHQTVTFYLPKEWGTPPKGNRDQKTDLFMLEYIPDSQDWSNWQDIFTIQGVRDFIKRNGIQIEKLVKQAELTARESNTFYKEAYRGYINGYQGAIIVQTVNSLAAKKIKRQYTGGEVVVVLFLAGEDDLYIVTRSWKADIPPINKLPNSVSVAEINAWIDLIRQVKLKPVESNKGLR